MNKFGLEKTVINRIEKVLQQYPNIEKEGIGLR
jgi:hypothetical protein